MEAKPKDFVGQTALITGGAGGVGTAVAGKLLERGCRVCLVDLSPQALQHAADALRTKQSLADLYWLEADVTDAEAAVECVRSIVARWGRLDVLVQTAGITGKTNVKTADVDPNDFDRVLRVNMRGIFVMCRAALPVMERQRYGRVVNIASIAGKEGNAGMLAYSTSKAAVIGLTKTIGKEYAESGITVNAIAPAVIQTAMVDAMPQQQVKYMTDKIPMKREPSSHTSPSLPSVVVPYLSLRNPLPTHG